MVALKSLWVSFFFLCISSCSVFNYNHSIVNEFFLTPDSSGNKAFIDVLLKAKKSISLQTFQLSDPNVIEAFEVAKDRSDLLIPVWFEGHEFLFILDTGCTSNVVDPLLKSALVPTGEMLPMNGKGAFAVYRSPTLALGKARIPIEGRAIMSDLVKIREFVGRDVRGILGMQFLRRHVLQIDYDTGRVAFLRTSKGMAGQRISIYFTHDGRPAVTLELPVAGNAPFVLDTGMGGWSNGALGTSAFDELAKGSQISVLEGTSRSISFDGEFYHRTGILASQTLQGNRHSVQLFEEGATGRPLR